MTISGMHKSGRNMYGYEVPYENWKGLIPHDEIPYDEMGHSEQGDFSQLTTGVYEYLTYQLNLVFKESIAIALTDTVAYRDIFDELLNAQIQDRVHITQRHTFALDRSRAVIDDKSFIDSEIKFIDELNVSFSEDMTFSSSYKNMLNIDVLDAAYIDYNKNYNTWWLNDRYGVDMLPHSEEAMEYYNDSFDRAIGSKVVDNIKTIDTHMLFKDNLAISFFDQLIGVETLKIKGVSKDITGIALGENLDVRLVMAPMRIMV